MNLSDKAKQLAPFIAKFVGAAVIGQEIGIIGDETHLPALGNLTPLAAPVLQMAKSVFENHATDFYKDILHRKNYGFNGNLQKAFNDALTYAVRELELEYQEKHPQANLHKAKSFFDELRVMHLPDNLNEDTIHRLVDVYVLNKNDFLLKLQSILPWGPDDELLEDHLLHFLVDRFPEHLEHALLMQLTQQEHEKARILFTIYLSEVTYRLAHDNQKIISDMVTT